MQLWNFWWSNSKDHKKIHWLGAKKMTLPKTLGDFGFKDLEFLIRLFWQSELGVYYMSPLVFFQDSSKEGIL